MKLIIPTIAIALCALPFAYLGYLTVVGGSSTPTLFRAVCAFSILGALYLGNKYVD